MLSTRLTVVAIAVVFGFRPVSAAVANTTCTAPLNTLLDLRNRTLTSIPRQLDTRCLTPEKLDLSNNYMTELHFPDRFFHSLQFQDLYVNNNRLHSLRGLEEFRGQRLYADNNQVSSLDDINNWNGRLLSVNNNRISQISFMNATNLLELYASRNSITSLELGGAHKLRILNAEYNSIRNIVPPTNSCSLEHIFIGNNHLRHLPKEIEKCPNVTILDASQNYMVEFNLPMITKTSQCIQHFGWTDGNFPDAWEPPYKCNLESIDLHRNQISSLSEGLLMCPKLKFLNISDNLISKIPEVLVQLLKHKSACGTKPDDEPEITVDLRNNDLKTEDVINSFKKFAKVEGNLLNFWGDNCECSVLRIENMKFAPVKYCISSMCGKNKRNEWKYYSTIH